MESRKRPERDEQDRSIEQRLDKLAEDIKRLPQERIDQLEKLVEKLAQSEVEKPVKKKVLSIQEAAKILDLSKDTIRRAIKAGHLHAFQLNEGGNWRISIDEVERYMKGDRE